MLELLAVGAGGFLGAIARYAAASYVQRLAGPGFPLGTFVVNLVGCLLIGIAFAVVETRPQLSGNFRLFAIVGLLGAFTTFSTFGHETYELLRGGAWGLALANVMGSALLGLIAVVAGRSLGRLV
jgi:CrcB protein